MNLPLKLRADALQWRQVDGDVVAVDLRTSSYLAFNRSASELWPLLLAGTTRGDLIDHLVEVYAIDRVQAESDVAVLLNGLREQDLLVA